MKFKLLLISQFLIFGINCESPLNCRCSLYTSESGIEIFSTGFEYSVPCNTPNEAMEMCQNNCDHEIRQLNDGFLLYPDMMKNRKPTLDDHTNLPQKVVGKFIFCDQPYLYPVEEVFNKDVCGDVNGNSTKWCDSNLFEYNGISRSLRLGDQTENVARGLDTKTDKNAIETNEIEGSTKDVHTQALLTSSTTTSSWVTYLMKFFGYSSISDMMQNVDIFSIPAKIKEAVVTYGDEIGMGQCYMEFTTYSVFTKQENPFEAFLRTKRDISEISENQDEFIEMENIKSDLMSLFEGRQFSSDRQNGDVQTIKHSDSTSLQSVVGGVADLLRSTESTRQYADIITKLLPTVLKIYTSNDPQQALSTLFTQVVTPIVAQQLQGSYNQAASTNTIEKNTVQPSRWPGLTRPQTPVNQRPASTGGGNSAITSMLLGLVKNAIGSYMNAPSIERIPQRVTRPPTTVPTRPPQSSLASSGLGTILGMLLGNNRQPAVAHKPRPKPPVKKIKPETTEMLEKKKRKDFTDTILELVRPVFISIVGKTPGESGVDTIREVSRLSTQGRVDDALKEEVLSPLFCMKNYAVNKAWTITERGIRSVVESFSPQQQERMKKMLF